MTSTPTADSDDGLDTIEPRSCTDHGDEPSVLETHSNTVPSSLVHHSFPPLLDDIGAVGMVEEDIALISKICSKIEQLSETDRLRPQIVILYSGKLFCMDPPPPPPGGIGTREGPSLSHKWLLDLCSLTNGSLTFALSQMAP